MKSTDSSLNSFESYLNSTRFIDHFTFSDKQKSILLSPSITFINEPIAINDTLTPSLQKTLEGLQRIIGNNNITFNLLYTEYTKVIALFSPNYIPYSFPDFINGLSIFELVFKHFNQKLLKISIQMTSEEIISVYFINEPESESYLIYQKYINNQPSDSPSLMLNNLLFTFFLFSLCGRFSYSTLNQINVINNINLYNKFYTSHLNYGLLIHLGVMVYFQSFNTSLGSNRNTNGDTMNHNRSNTPNLTHWTKYNSNTSQAQRKSVEGMRFNSDNNSNNIQGSSKVLTSNNVLNTHPEINIVLLDNIINSLPLIDCVKVSLCSNGFKWFLYESLPNVFNAIFNITIISPIELSNTFFGQSFEATFYSKAIEKSNLSLVSSNGFFSKLFKIWPLNNVIFQLDLTNQLNSITSLFSIYNIFLVKATEIHVKNNTATLTNNTVSYMSIDTLLSEWSLLESILSKMSTLKEKKKHKASSYSFLFNCWKLIINKSSSSKEVNLYYNYSHIQEKALFNFFLCNTNLYHYIKNLMKVICLLEAFKGDNAINIRLFQNNFRSKQLEFFLQIIVNSLVNYVIDKKIDDVININEKNFNYYIPSMQCYLNDLNDNNKKRKVNALKETFRKITSIYKCFKFLSIYLSELSELYDIVIFSENPNSFKLIRTYEDRKIFFILSRKESPYIKCTRHSKTFNTVSNDRQNSLPISITSTSASTFKVEYNMHIYVYLNNNRENYTRTLPLLHNIKTDKGNNIDIEITLICDKYYLESTVLIDQKHKKLVRYLSEDISNLYIISKTSSSTMSNGRNCSFTTQNNAEYFNYDIYITSKEIKLMTYMKYDFLNDPKYKKFLYSFISIISSCIDMILYILKNKDIYISKFSFIYKNSHDTTYLLYFKEGNVLFEKSYDSDNLIKLKVRNSIPLFCLLSKKKTTSYTMSTENFFDVFTRLFLNLHKVNNDYNDNLNEVLFKKIHKSIFYDYYENFFPIALSNEAFDIFNKLFISNDYLIISNGDRFVKGYLFCFDTIAYYNKSFDQMVFKEVILFYSNIKMLSREVEETYKILSFSKLDYLIDSLKDIIENQRKEKGKMIGYLLKKVNSKDTVISIFKYLFHERVRECYIDQNVIKEKIEGYLRDKAMRENERVENRITQLTEAAKYENIIVKDNTKCYLF